MINNSNREKYKNIGMKQKKGIINIFNNFFKKEKFNAIVEIGTGNGAFSIYLAEKAKKMNASFMTFDIKKINKKIKKELNNLGGIFYHEDINKNTKIETLLKKSDRVLILNDGALKLPQFKRFSPLLKKNDCLMTHDYFTSKDKKGPGRIVFDEVIEYIKKYQLTISYEKELEPFIWLCCIKEKI